ncbi:CoB--CoM heterodisulfide reductase iron-sulfur subunit A family protein [Candidatus Bathyarchaeota archaeon]|nr:CoB--CoM heterodisulfide reductase iron-sulfur subunit A family protein [Candidatus Bathyarchaeota archaeon]
MNNPEEKPRIGVYICHCGTNIAGVINVEELRQYCEKLPNVVTAKVYDYFCSIPGQEMIKDDIGKLKLNRVIVAACSPRMHEPTFRKVNEEAGLNPYLFEMVNIREQDTWVHMRTPGEALNIAKDLLRMAVARAEKLRELEPKKVPVKRKVLIIGGGIAGISAALDLADSNFEVYLVEKSPTIGGKMAQLDKTFPTMDCSSCILTPKMVDVTRRENIHLLTYSEVKNVEGYVGNFKVTVVKKPRYVIEDKCNGCGKCVEVCPIEVPNEFDEGLSPRKAIYVPFPQAVPQVYTIDMDSCFECDKCIEACHEEGLDAIDFDQKPEEIEIEVGTIIVASGYDIYDAVQTEEYGYGVYPNVLTALEMERILSAGGPTYGDIIRPSDRKKPQSIAYIQCVGSRDVTKNPYCSRICCMYAIKQARQIKEKMPNAEVYILYTDIRAFGKGYEEFYEIAGREYGIRFIRGRAAEVIEDPKTQNLTIKAEDTLLGRTIEVEVDVVVLSVGMVPSEGADNLQKQLKLSKSPDNFFLEAHPKLRPVDTVVDGVFICGASQGPKDIPDVVAQAKAAASSASTLMSQGVFTIEPYFAVVNDDLCSGCGICEVVCPYDAISIEEETAKVEEVSCKGCGSCAAACPTGAITTNNFTDTQILSQIREAMPRGD